MFISSVGSFKDEHLPFATTLFRDKVCLTSHNLKFAMHRTRGSNQAANFLPERYINITSNDRYLACKAVRACLFKFAIHGCFV